MTSEKELREILKAFGDNCIKYDGELTVEQLLDKDLLFAILKNLGVEDD